MLVRFARSPRPSAAAAKATWFSGVRGVRLDLEVGSAAYAKFIDPACLSFQVCIS
jgi:hypothetical protein